MASSIQGFLDRVATALQAVCPEGVAVVVEDRMEAAAEVQRALGELSGLAVVVGLESASAARGQGGPVMLEARARVMVIEAPELNRRAGGSGMSALELAERMLDRLLNGGDDFGCAAVALGEPTVARREVELNGELYSGAEIRLSGAGLELQAVRGTIEVEGWIEGEKFMMSLEPAGARGFFTMDGSRPRVLSARVWTGPVDAPGGSHARFFGALPGSWNSEVRSIDA